MGTAKEHRAWVNSTDDLTIEKFSIKFEYSEPRVACDHFTIAVKSSRLKNHVKEAILNNLELWRKNKSHATLFWLDQGRRVAIKKGKLIAMTSLVAVATEELPEFIRSEGTLNESSTTTSSTSGLSIRIPSSRLAEKRRAERIPDAPSKKKCGSTVTAGTSHDLDHDHNDDHDGDHQDEGDDDKDNHNNSDNNNNTTVSLPRTLFDEAENVDQYFFESPVSAWKDIQAFCKKALDSKCDTSSTTAFRRYTHSLMVIAKKTEQIQNCARKASNVGEACFRTQYISVVNRMAQEATDNITKRSNGQEALTDD
ncbi:MAG: hypothetical protein J3Q66DRAFT_187352 [Benniella sp.]|nr:MAG: hypothetical protein J3Q66DRAFT_187352 [Benniella sp.]